jgi:hypothetical protein
MFVYHAQASSLGGVIRRPLHQLIDSSASSSLASIGGSHTSSSGKFAIPGVMSVESAFTHVTGSFDSRNNGHATLAKSVVEGFRLQEVVTADRIVAQYSSLYRVGADEPEIRPLGTQFVNLRINGVPVEPRLRMDFHCRYSTYSSIRDAYQSDEQLRSSLDRVNYWKRCKEELPEPLRHLPFAQTGTTDFPEDGVVCCTLLEEELEIPGAISHGPMIYIPDFGRIFLAEYQIRKKSRRLTMLRFDLGSPLEASISAGELEGNGSPIP